MIRNLLFLCFVIVGFSSCHQPSGKQKDVDLRIEDLLQKMTLDEKIGQMSQVNSVEEPAKGDFAEAIQKGEIGSVLNEARPEKISEMQRIAAEESRLGIPLLFGRDIIHGFKTIFPINIGMAATFNPQLIEEGNRAAMIEAKATGINWNFAPMVDITRDPRWGRLAESFGEDPLLVTKMGLAVLNGFQGDNPDGKLDMAACAKHFAGYGAAEGGRDYNTTYIPKVELWNNYFKPFKALNDAGIASFMTGFNELNGVPASGNEFLFREVLRDTWGFKGLVVSDWSSITEMIAHGFAADPKEAAFKAIKAGVDMEMASTSYRDELKKMVETGAIDEKLIDDAVRNILRVKFKLGLFDKDFNNPKAEQAVPFEKHLKLARKTARESFVLLENRNQMLPLNPEKQKIALIGPMADDAYEQLGTWVFDGDTNLSITPYEAFSNELGDRLIYAKGLDYSRDKNRKGFKKAIQAAQKADAVVLCLGEESIITGEAHSRAYLDFPGAQEELFRQIHASGKPIILVVMTSRPLCIGDLAEQSAAVLYVWHPGSMAGPAMADVLFGRYSPSGRLPITFPKAPGQIPVYYAQKNTGRPASKESMVHIDDIPRRSFQTSLGNTSHYLDIGLDPLYPFGYGLTYTTFEYGAIKLQKTNIGMQETLSVSIDIKNTGSFAAAEVVQLYVRDKVASITRPVKELKIFQKLHLEAGESETVFFELPVSDLGFFDEEGKYHIEAGEFRLWIGPDAASGNYIDFTLKP